MPKFKSLIDVGNALAGTARELETTEKRKITRAQGKRGQQIADDEVAKDLGPKHAFSHWRRDKPIPLATHLIDARRSATILAPTKVSAGPWTVANDGRFADGGVGRFQGPGVNLRTGATTRSKKGNVIVRRRRKSVRYSGGTGGFGTADRAVKRFQRELPKIADDGVRQALSKRFDVT